MAELMMKNMNSTVGYLETELPLTLVSRVMASTFKADSTDCTTFWNNAYIGKSAEDAATYCENIDLTNPNDVLIYLNATWYGGIYSDEFAVKYEMTAF